MQWERSTRRRGVQAMVHTAPDTHNGAGLRQASFSSPSSAKGGALMQISVHPATGIPWALVLKLSSHPKLRRLELVLILLQSPGTKHLLKELYHVGEDTAGEYFSVGTRQSPQAQASLNEWASLSSCEGITGQICSWCQGTHITMAQSFGSQACFL